MSASPEASLSSSGVTDEGLDGRAESRGWGMDSMSTEWTDEKHNLYLSSIEESFISQLYSSEYGPNESFGRLLRSPKQLKSSGYYAKNLSSCQLKVLRGNHWEKLNFERVYRADTKNETCGLTTNPWIQHFRPQIISKEQQLTSKQVDDNDLYNPVIHSKSQKNQRKATNPKQLQALCSRIYNQDSVGSSTEVSDQNFVDMDIQGGKQLNRVCRQKRPRAEVDDSQDKE